MKRQKIIGSTIRSRSIELKGKVMDELFKNTWNHFENREIIPIIYDRVPINKSENAHDIMKKNDNIGKIILEVS